MNYIKEVSEKIDLVNEVLDEIKAPHLLENPDFSVDYMSMESWLKINLNDKGQNKIPLSLTFTRDNLEIGIDRFTEALDWSNKDLNKSKTFVMKMLIIIFTSYIFVEYHGLSRTLIRFFDRNGKFTNRFKFIDGLSFKGKREYRLYFPIYQ